MPLTIPGNQTTATINVKLVSSGKAPGAQFSLDGGATWHTAPIQWNPPGNSAPLNITWVFDKTVTGIATKSGNITLTTTAQVAVAKGEDGFWVINTDGNGDDPKIVINPQ